MEKSNSAMRHLLCTHCLSEWKSNTAMRQYWRIAGLLKTSNSAMRRFGWRIAAFEINTGACQALYSISDPLLLSQAMDPAFAASYIIARRTALIRARFIFSFN